MILVWGWLDGKDLKDKDAQKVIVFKLLRNYKR